MSLSTGPRARARRAARWLRSFALASGALLTVVPSASASAWFTYGLGARAMAMGNAYAAIADDYSAPYTNPAGVVARDLPQLGLGFVYYDIDLELNGRSAGVADVPSGVLSTTVPLPIGELVGIDLAFGFAIQLSGDVLLEQDVAFPTVPQFVLIENYSRMLHLLPTVAVRPFPGLNIGGGLLLFDETTGKLELGLGARDEAAFSVDQELKTIGSTILGLQLFPGEVWPELAPLSFGFVWRDSFDVPYSIPVQALLGGLPLEIDFRARALYTPEQYEFGVAWQSPDGWLVAAGLSFNRWSQFPDPTLSIDLDVEIPILPIVFSDSLLRDPDFSDTWTPRIGAEARVARFESAELSVRGGYFFEKSPAPEQTGDTSFLDNDRHVLSAGAGLLMRELFGRPLEHALGVDFYAQLHLLVDRTHRKGPEATGERAGQVLHTGGTILNLGVMLSTELSL